MKQVAFKVVKDSEFYKQYFETKAEQQKFHDLAGDFFKKHDLIDKSKEYYQTKFLALGLTAEQKERFAGQLKKDTDNRGMSIFKKKSPMQKMWNEDVTSKIDFYMLNQNDWWYGTLISQGSYSLWDYEGEIYGYLSDKYKEEIELPDYFTKIKLSEYYSVIEEMEQRKEDEGK